MTRSRVSCAIGTRVGTLLSTRDTVLCDTAAAAAISRIVTIRRRAAGSVAGSGRPDWAGAVSVGWRGLRAGIDDTVTVVAVIRLRPRAVVNGTQGRFCRVDHDLWAMIDPICPLRNHDHGDLGDGDGGEAVRS